MIVLCDKFDIILWMGLYYRLIEIFKMVIVVEVFLYLWILILNLFNILLVEKKKDFDEFFIFNM